VDIQTLVELAESLSESTLTLMRWSGTMIRDASLRVQSRHPSNWSMPPRILLDLVAFAAILRPAADPSECAVSTLHKQFTSQIALVFIQFTRR